MTDPAVQSKCRCELRLRRRDGESSKQYRPAFGPLSEFPAKPWQRRVIEGSQEGKLPESYQALAESKCASFLRRTGANFAGVVTAIRHKLNENTFEKSGPLGFQQGSRGGPRLRRPYGVISGLAGHPTRSLALRMRSARQSVLPSKFPLCPSPFAGDEVDASPVILRFRAAAIG